MKNFVIILCVLIMTACASKKDSYVVLMPNPDGSQGKIIVSNNKNEQVTVDQAGVGANMLAKKLEAKLVNPEKIEKDFAEAQQARPALPVTYLLYFKTGGSILTAESEALIPKILGEVETRQVPDISIIGHTDTVGKAEGNEALALKRAQAIAEKIQAAGLKTKEITVTSHGERNLLIATPDETSEEKNRRVEITVR